MASLRLYLLFSGSFFPSLLSEYLNAALLHASCPVWRNLRERIIKYTSLLMNECFYSCCLLICEFSCFAISGILSHPFKKIVPSNVCLIRMGHYRDSDLTSFISSHSLETIFRCFPLLFGDISQRKRISWNHWHTKNELKVIFSRTYRHLSSSRLPCHVCDSIFCCATDSTWKSSLLPALCFYCFIVNAPLTIWQHELLKCSESFQETAVIWTASRDSLCFPAIRAALMEK